MINVYPILAEMANIQDLDDDDNADSDCTFPERNRDR